MKRRQTKFFTEQEIIDRIDTLKEKARELLASSCRHDELAHECLVSVALESTPPIGEEAQLRINRLYFERENHLKESERLNKTRHRIEEATLPKLKEALAAMRTEVMPLTEDKSVVLG